jgi:hypothetical protein
VLGVPAFRHVARRQVVLDPALRAEAEPRAPDGGTDALRAPGALEE